MDRTFPFHSPILPFSHSMLLTRPVVSAAAAMATGLCSPKGALLHTPLPCKGVLHPWTASGQRTLSTLRPIHLSIPTSFSLPRRVPLRVSLTLASLTTGAFLYYTSDLFKHKTLAVRRVLLAAEAVVVTGYDYKYSLSYGNQDLNRDKAEDETERRIRRRRLHKRSAERVMRMMRENGGIYIKLGQHLASLKYLLPEEWTRTMEPLQDRCAPSSLESIQALFLSDLGQPMSEVFSSFKIEPIGVASLAQVHKATLKDGQEVAVKIQHPALSEFSEIDMQTISALTKFIAYAFPEFEFFWLSEEIQDNLPKELDFRYEAKNAARTEANFNRARASGSPSTVKIPGVVWAQKRVLVMEFMDGSRIDDLPYLHAHNIKVSEVSKEMARTFSQMIYKDGFLHCDPHPGNVMIRPKPANSPSHRNFEIILLDHGLYRELSQEFRLDYAKLWTAVIASDEEEIKRRALKLGGIDAYELFACILTGRDWDVIQGAELTRKVRNKAETSKISQGAGNWLVEIADILARVPRDLLLLFKTNDLLRALDEDLGVDDGAQMRTFAVMGRYCAEVILEAEKAKVQQALVSGRNKVSLSLLTRSVKAWCRAYLLYIYKVVSLDVFVWWIDLSQSGSALHWIVAKIERLYNLALRTHRERVNA